MQFYKYFIISLYSLILSLGPNLWANVELLEKCLKIPDHYFEANKDIVQEIKQQFENNSLLLRSLDIRKEGDLDREIKFTSAIEGNANRSATLLVKDLPIKVYYDLGVLIIIKDLSDIKGLYKGDIGSGTGTKKEVTTTSVNYLNFANLIRYYSRVKNELVPGDYLPHNEIIFTNRIKYINGAWFKTPSEKQTEASLIIDALRINNRLHQVTKINYPVFKYQSRTGSLNFYPISKLFLIDKLDARYKELEHDFGALEAANLWKKLIDDLNIINICDNNPQS